MHQGSKFHYKQNLSTSKIKLNELSDSYKFSREIIPQITII